MSIIEIIFFPLTCLFWVAEHAELVCFVVFGGAGLWLLLTILQPVAFLIGGLLSGMAEAARELGSMSRKLGPSALSECKSGNNSILEKAARQEVERKERRATRLERRKHKRELLNAARKRYKLKKKGKLNESSKPKSDTVEYPESADKDGVLRPVLLQ